MFKVLQLNKAFWPVIGGVEKVVYDLAKGLGDFFDMSVLAVGEDGHFKREQFKNFMVYKTPRLTKIASTPISLNYTTAFKLLAPQMDLLHFHLPHPFGVLAYARYPFTKKILVTYHCDVVKQKTLNILYEPMMHFLLKRASKIVVSNPNIINTSQVLRRYRDKCIVIPFGIDIDKMKLKPEEKLRLVDLRKRYNKPVVLFVGRLVYYKGVEYLIKAMKDVDAYLIIIGNGPLKTDLLKLTQNLNLTNKTTFIDHLPRSELKLYFHLCDVFVLPSIARTEAFGLVLLEAMACGKPLISTELGTGTSFINQHEVTGFVVPVANSQSLVQTINKILNNKTSTERLSSSALWRVKNIFSFKLFIENYYSFYKELLPESL